MKKGLLAVLLVSGMSLGGAAVHADSNMPSQNASCAGVDSSVLAHMHQRAPAEHALLGGYYGTGNPPGYYIETLFAHEHGYDLYVNCP